jgi:hypothetical protein
MTKDEKAWAAVLGALMAIVTLFFVVAACVIAYSALDEGGPHAPSEWQRR